MQLFIYARPTQNPQQAIADRKEKATNSLQTGAGTDLPGSVDGWIAHLDTYAARSHDNALAVASLPAAELGQLLLNLGPTLQFGYDMAMAGAAVALEHQSFVVSAAKDAPAELNRLQALRTAVARAQRAHYAFAAPPPRSESIH